MKLVANTAVLICLLALFTAQLPETIMASYMIGAGALLKKILKAPFRRKHLNALIIFSTLLLPSVLTFNHGITPLFYLISSPFIAFLAYDFSKNSLENIVIVLRNIYWLFVIFIAIALAINWDDPEPLGAILPWASTNGIPSYLIVVQIAYSIAFHLSKNRLPLLSSAATLAVAVFGLGRGSMIVGALILLFSVFLNLFIIKSKNDWSITWKIALICIILLLIFFGDNTLEFSNVIGTWFEGSKFSSGVLDEHRVKINNDYLNKIDGISLIIGTSYENTSINELYGGNPHNSFIRVHSFFGLAALLSLFAPLFLILISQRNSIQKIVVLMLIMFALLRATSEPIFFPSTLDFFYFLYFALFFRFSKRRVELREKNVHSTEIYNCKNP